MRKRLFFHHLIVAWLLSLVSGFAWAADDMDRRVAACTQCHGDQGRATAEAYYPRIAGKPVSYLYSQLLGFRDGRRTHPSMVSIVSGLSDAYLYEMATHFSRQNPPYPSPAPAADKASVLALGESIARKGSGDDRVPACTSCHGQQLTGLNPVMPGLLGLSRDYLNAQLGAWSNGARKAAGPDCMAEIVKRMKSEELSAVSAWLSSQPVVAKVPGLVRDEMQGKRFPLECGTHRAPAVHAQDSTNNAAVTAHRFNAGNQSKTALPLDESRSLLKSDASPAARRGAYLAVLGNCAGCHTAPGKPAYSGGRAIETPYGVVFANNITPDEFTGVGNWTADEFHRALTQGISRDGHRLYPAFPWPYYARFSRAESDDLWAFLQQLEPVRHKPQAARMNPPYNWRPLLAVWDVTNRLRATPVTAQMPLDARQKRGEWLVNGPGHCGACHTPKGLLGQDDTARHLSGADMPANGWHAPSLGASDDARYLGTGADDRRMAAGPMAQVIYSSLQYWQSEDIAAASAYLKRLPQAAETARRPGRGALSPVELERSLVNGRRTYERHCADCHGESGEGRAGQAPALVWKTAAGQIRGTSLPNAVKLVLNGGYAPATAGNPRPYGMPPFRTDLSSQAIADVLTWMTLEWKYGTAPVTAADVDRYRGSWNAQH